MAHKPDRAGPNYDIIQPLALTKSAAVSWIWPGRIPAGKVTMIAGDPKVGKSLLAATIAATISAGGRWPVDDSKARAGRVIMLSAEDDPGDTIRPRVEAAGGNVGNVSVITTVPDIDDAGQLCTRPFSMLRDLQQLAAEIKTDPHIRALIIDPISAYLCGIDSHRNSDVREMLHPLSVLAAETGAAVICITHLNKAAVGIQNALYRVTGSLAFTAAARAVHLVAPDPTEPARRLFLPAGSNLAADGIGGLAYTITSTGTDVGPVPVLQWDPDPVTITTLDALQPQTEEHTERSEAAEWLAELLADGPMPAKEVRAAADAAGLAWRTVQRARKSAGITTTRTGFGAGSKYEWSRINE